MSEKRSEGDRRRPLYMISVAADLAGMHPQTLRIYERKLLIKPQRSAGNTRLFSDADIERLRLIQELTAEGINLAGVVRILELEREVARLHGDIERWRVHAEDLQHRIAAESERVRSEYRAEIVMVHRGGLARREGL